MNKFLQSATPETDSMEYRLLNMSWCWIYPDRKKFDMSYRRGTHRHNIELTYTQLRTVHPQLPEIVEELSEMHDRASQELLDHLRTTTAHLVGAYVDFGLPNSDAWHYRYFSHIQQVRSSTTPGFFVVEGLSYRQETKKIAGVVCAKPNPRAEQLVPVEAMERVWPGSSKQIPIMEALGYSGEDILNALEMGLRGVPDDAFTVAAGDHPLPDSLVGG